MPVSISRWMGTEPGLRARSACGGEQLVELPRLPRNGGELKLNGSRGLTGKDAADDEHASLGAQAARERRCLLQRW
jgi:hypothetical protein